MKTASDQVNNDHVMDLLGSVWFSCRWSGRPVLNPAVSPAKGLLLEHQQHIRLFSPRQKLRFKSSRETMASTRGKIESDKSVLNSVWRMLIHINGDRNICKWIHWQRGLNITLHRRGGIITPILAWDSAVSDSSPCTVPANTKPLSLHWASPESLQFLASLEPELSLLLAQRLRGGLVESTKPPSPLDRHTFPSDNGRLVGQRHQGPPLYVSVIATHPPKPWVQQQSWS